MTRVRQMIVLAALVALLASACNDGDGPAEADPTTTTAVGAERGPPPTTSTTVAPADYDFSDVADTVDAFVEAEGLNGAGLTIVHRDEGVIFEHYAGEFDPDRISLIASSSKMITAGVLMRLHDEGVLDVDAPVAEVAEWGSANPEITPVQLISNSSGLVGLFDGVELGTYLCQYGATGTMEECAEQIFTSAEDDDDVAAPDTEFRYGGAQWQVAGAVAEIASGQSWAELVDETYVEPCGVDSLGYNNHYSQISSDEGPFTYPHAFGGDPANLEPTDNPNMEAGAYITAEDYGALLLMHLRDGQCDENRVLSEESVQRMHTDRIGPTYDGDTAADFETDLEGYGLGWWVDDDPAYIQDAGAFGTVPWLDLDRGYGAYLVVERTTADGQALAAEIQPLIDQQIPG